MNHPEDEKCQDPTCKLCFPFGKPTPLQEECDALKIRDAQWQKKYEQAHELWNADNVRNNDEITSLRAQLSTLTRERDEALKFQQENYETILQLRKQIQELEARLERQKLARKGDQERTNETINSLVNERETIYQRLTSALAECQRLREAEENAINGAATLGLHLQSQRNELRKLLEDVTGKEADGVAHDLDHGNFHRNSWWRKVLKARRVLLKLARKSAALNPPKPE